jgi:hypothetical protein
MNRSRPYYALMAMLAVLSGSTIAIGPARPTMPTAQLPMASRALCGLQARDCLLTASLFGATGTECPAFAADRGYPSACGYDAFRGEVYQGDLLAEENASPQSSTDVDYWSLYSNSSGVAPLVENQEVWPTDARIDDSYLKFERGSAPAQCGGDLDCPHADCESFGTDYNTWIDDGATASEFNYWTAYDSGFDYWTAYTPAFDYWTAYVDPRPAATAVAADNPVDWDCQVCYPTFRDDEAVVATNAGVEELAATVQTLKSALDQLADQLPSFSRFAPADESVFFAAATEESWKTAAVETPAWIDDYVAGSNRSAERKQIELEYAQAELQAAIEAGAVDVAVPYGPQLPAFPSPDRVTYSNEYESLYDLDAVLADEAAAFDAPEAVIPQDESPLMKAMLRVFDELLQQLNVPADPSAAAASVYDAAQSAVEQAAPLAQNAAEWLRAAERSAPLAHNAPAAAYDHMIGHSADPSLPVEAAESRNMLESVARSLRLTGQMLLVVADNLEAEAGRVMSARAGGELSR